MWVKGDNGWNILYKKYGKEVDIYITVTYDYIIVSSKYLTHKVDYFKRKKKRYSSKNVEKNICSCFIEIF